MKNKDFYTVAIAFLIGLTLWLAVCFGLTHLLFFFFPGIAWGFWKVFLAVVIVSFLLNSIGN